jgi:hypothetical protein
MRDSVTFRDPASSRLTINRHRNIALKLPLAVFAPECSLGNSSPNRNHEKMSPNGLIFSWLGIRDDYRTLIGVNGLDIIEKKNEEQNEENSHV